jgi:hypothetical protein
MRVRRVAFVTEEGACRALTDPRRADVAVSLCLACLEAALIVFASTRDLASESSCSRTYRTRCSGGTGLSWGLSTLLASSCTRLWMALRSDVDGFGPAGLAIPSGAGAVAYCRIQGFCDIGAFLWYAVVLALVLRCRCECVLPRGARQRHCVVFCALLNTPRHSLRVATLLISILVYLCND